MNGRTAWRRASACLLATFFSFIVSAAAAQSAQERAGARVAAEEGAKAFREGRFEEAIDLFNRAESVVHAPPHLLFIARASAKIGKLVEAREAYMRIIKENLGDSAPQAFTNAQEAANEELPELEPRIPYVTAKIQGSPEGAVLKIDGKELLPALVGVPTPVNPGSHELVASIRGVDGPVATVGVEEGQRASVDVIPPDASALPPEGEGLSEASEPTGAASGNATMDTGSGSPVPAYIALGVGAVGIGVGTLFLLSASSTQGDADDKFSENSCATRVCSEDIQNEIKSLSSDAASANTLSLVGFTVGGAAVITGVILLVSSSGSSSASSTELQPWVGLGSAGLRGSF